MEIDGETVKQLKSPIDRLRAACLARGATGIYGICRLFSIMDDDGNRKLSYDEFKKGVKEYSLDLPDDDIYELFNAFDTDHSGYISREEFIVKIRPPMSKARIALINKAYDKLDRNGDGKITVEDLKGVYIATSHPNYLNGTWTEDQVIRNFLNVFDKPNDDDGIITREEFTNYYAGVSASIDTDVYFDTMMRKCWKL